MSWLWTIFWVVVIARTLWLLTVGISRFVSPKWACKNMDTHDWRPITKPFPPFGDMCTGFEKCSYCKRKRREPEVPDDGGYEVGQ